MNQMKPLIIFVTVTLTLVTLTGCSVYRAASVETGLTPPVEYHNKGGGLLTFSPREAWWRIFNDQTLNRLMEKTFTGNLNLVQAAARMRQALALNKQRGADLRPYVNLDAGAGRSRQGSAAGASTGSSYSVSLAAGYEIDLWNRLKSLSDAQLLETQATRQDLHALFLSLSAQVAENYFIMVEQRAKLKLIDQTIAARLRNVELVEQRYREGMRSSLDLYQARQNLAFARSQRPGVEERLTHTAHALSVLTGEYPDSKIGGRLNRLPEMPKTFPLGLPSELLKARPDIQADLLRLQAIDRQVAAAVAERFPSINLLAGYGYSGSDFGTRFSGSIWNLTGNLFMPLIDWNRRKAEVERREALFQEKLAQYRQNVLTAFQEVEDALAADHFATDAIEKLDVEVAAAEQSLRLSLERYTNGLSDYLPVLTAQTNHFDSQIRLLTARRQLISARISLCRALGGSWMEQKAVETLQPRKG